MTETRYHFLGTPLTDQERELLTIMQEECAEVIQAASKLLRFGKEYYDGYGDNQVVLGLEIGDTQHMFELLITSGLISIGVTEAGKERKAGRLKLFMRHIDVVDMLNDMLNGTET